MIVANAYVTGSAFLAVGLLSGYLLWYWRDRYLRQGAFLEKQSVLDHARREAESRHAGTQGMPG